MIVTGHMNFFDVAECGLYRNGSTKAAGIELSDTFSLITSWVANKPMAATMPWEGEKRADGNKCYCYDFYHDEDTDEYLVVLWKSGADSNGTLLGAEENANAGAGKVIEYTDSYRGNRVIWGRPCYYWILPAQKAVVSIKFEHSVCDSQLFQDWVAACINNHVKHPNKKKEYTEGGQARLSFTDGTVDGNARYRYSFDMSLKSLDTANGKLSELAGKVTHIVKRETMRISLKDERAEWVKRFDKIPYLAPKKKSEKRQIEIRAEAQPTVSELRDIIQQFARDDRRPTDWDNVGFETDKGTVWVDRYRMKDEVNVNFTSSVIPASVMYERLQVNRERYIAPLKRPTRSARPRSVT